jgi:hypothetical protein
MAWRTVGPWVVAKLLTFYLLAQAVGYPTSLVPWYKCVTVRDAASCKPFRDATNELLALQFPPLSLSPEWIWRAAAPLAAALLLFWSHRVSPRSWWPVRPRSAAGRFDATAFERRAAETRIEWALARAHDREQALRDISELDALLTTGRGIHMAQLKSQLKAAELEATRRLHALRAGSTAPLAVPVEPYPGQEGDEWSGSVLFKLKTMTPPALAEYFQACVAAERDDAFKRMSCYLERLETIIAELRKRVP